MAKQQNKIPEVRFPEFKEDWEVKRLGKIAKITTGSTPSTSNKEYYNGKRHFISPADIQGNRYILNTIKKLSDLGISKGRLIHKNDVVFVCIGSTIGKTAQATQECITNQQINTLSALNGFNNNFIYTLLEWNGQKIKLLAGVQAVPQINKTDFSNLTFPFPTLPEQQKIAHFFSIVDKKLMQLQEKKTALELYKKGMMQQIFSQQLRFKDDNGEDFPEWEAKNLGNVFNFKQGFQFAVNEQSEMKFQDSVEFIRIINVTSDINDKRYVLDPGEEHHINKDDLFMVRYGDAGRVVNNFSGIIANNMFRLLPKIEVNNMFFFHSLGKLYNKIHSLSGSSTMPAISFSAIDKLKIKVPSIKEQTKIANFLSKIDDKIHTVTEKIEQTKEYKKGLLQKMFV